MDLITLPLDDPKLKRAQSLVGSSAGRPADDYYPTPPEAVHALLGVEAFDGEIWEPACGDGAICRVLEEYGYPLRATDLVDRGYGEAPHDFLTSTYTSTNIITNPPYRLAEKFVELSLARATHKVAMLCKLQFLEGVRRKNLFQTSPLARVWVFSKRLTMTRNGRQMDAGGMICFAWFVWSHSHEGPPLIGWL